jgi:hypothetical protein
MNTTLKKPNMVPYLVRRTGNMAKNMVANMERPALEIMGLTAFSTKILLCWKALARSYIEKYGMSPTTHTTTLQPL